MNATELKKFISEGKLDEKLITLYGEANVEARKERYLRAVDSYVALYGDSDTLGLYSVPGRSELSGNHTDHNAGCVIACSIDLDIIAVASPTDDNVIRIKSEGYPEDVVDLDTYNTPDTAKYGSSASIIAGMAAGIAKEGGKVGGLKAYTTSNVLKGSGLSSSAAFEVMVGNLLNHIYNDGRIDNVEIAKLSQYAENVFFGKPCGLMDQVACANGGIVAIDFATAGSPVIESVDFDIPAAGYSLCIVDTGGNHADLTDDYASVPAEMKAVAAELGAPVLRGTDRASLMASLKDIREKCGDRACLRAFHFFAENERVAEQKKALLANDIHKFFEGVIASGRSSFCYLQNVYTTKNVSEQGLSLALCLAEQFLSGKDGAFRVHGGGFAGTVQAFVPHAEVEGYRAMMDSVFGEGACLVLRVRPLGAISLL